MGMKLRFVPIIMGFKNLTHNRKEKQPMKIGDIVCYIREDDEYDKKLGFYPPIGTLGRIVETCEDSIGVKWARGATKGDGIWFCDVDDIKLMPTVSGWIMSGIFDNFAK